MPRPCRILSLWKTLHSKCLRDSGLLLVKTPEPISHRADVVVLNTGTMEDLAAKIVAVDFSSSHLYRPDWDTYFMRLALLASRRSNCMKRAVGAVIVMDNRVISTGYNGTPRGTKYPSPFPSPTKLTSAETVWTEAANDATTKRPAVPASTSASASTRRKTPSSRRAVSARGGRCFTRAPSPASNVQKRSFRRGYRRSRLCGFALTPPPQKIVFDAEYVTDDVASSLLATVGVQVRRHQVSSRQLVI
jgi:hypothetical protein